MAVSPSIYIWWQYKFAEHKITWKSDALDMLRHYNVPKKIKPIILKEMQQMKLIKINGDYISVINCKVKEEFQFYDNMDRLTRRRQFEKDIN